MKNLDDKVVNSLQHNVFEYNTNYSVNHQKCQHLRTEIRPHHYHAAGEYCSDCGKWIKWISKKDYSRNYQKFVSTRLNGGVA